MTQIQEAQALAKEIIDYLELSRGSLQELLFKALRVCKLIKDERGQTIFKFETCGYDRNSDGELTKESWDIMKTIGRTYYMTLNKEKKMYAEPRLVSELLNENDILFERMKVASDPQSYGDNMTPFMINTAKNSDERAAITERINHNNNFVNAVKGFLYNYMLNTYNALCYGSIAQNIYENIRATVDSKIAEFCPENTKRFLSVYENLTSNNEEDWANSVNSCRRIIVELANKLYPPQDEPVVKGDKKINVKEENYVNRLVLYIESKSTSETYSNITGAELNYIGQVLDSITKGLNKGTHAVYSKSEAERVVVYTYLLIGDILSL